MKPLSGNGALNPFEERATRFFFFTGEAPYIREVVEKLSQRTALVPWVAEEPVGPENLRQLFNVNPVTSG